MDATDGTFLIGFHDWSEFYTHLFACLVFPSTWHTARITGEWKGASAGGAILPNGDASSWKHNPKYHLVLRTMTDATAAMGKAALPSDTVATTEVAPAPECVHTTRERRGGGGHGGAFVCSHVCPQLLVFGGAGTLSCTWSCASATTV